MRFRFLLAWSFILGLSLTISVVAQQSNEFEVLIKNGMVYDGSGGKPRRADVGIDVYNVFNSGDATAYDQAFTIGTTATQRFLYPTSIVAPRFGRFNLTLSF